MNLRYNYAAAAVVLVVFTWAALAPEDDGFNTLLGTGYDNDDDDDDDDDDEGYDGRGYEGRDKGLAGQGQGGSVREAGRG